MGEVLDAADVIDMGVRQDLQIDVPGAEADARELAGRQMLRPELQDAAEFVEPVLARGGIAILQVLAMEAGIDEDVPAVVVESDE